MVTISELYLSAMTGFAEVAEQLRDGSDFESELRTTFAKGLERMNRLEGEEARQAHQSASECR